MAETFGVRPIQDLSRGEIASYLDMLEAQSGGMRSLRFQPGQTSPYSREDLQNQLNVLTETQRVLAAGNRPFLGMESNLPGSLMTPPPEGGFSPGMGLPQPPPQPLPPVEDRAVRPLPPITQQPEPQQQPAALLPGPQAAVAAPVQQAAQVAAQAQQPQGSGFSFGSGNTLLGLAALSDAFAIYGGRQPTSLAQIAPIAMRREATQSAIQEINRRLGASNLTPEQRAIVGGAAQQAVSAAPAAQGEVPVLRAAPGQDPNEVRGVRTNNPLNLSFANQPNAIGTDGRFAVFQTPEEGVAASVRQLQLYGQRGLNTIDQIVSRWAPPSENNTPAYIQAVAQRVGVSPNQEIDLSDPNIMRRLVNAMSVQEVGRVIPEDVLQRGVELGYQPPQQRQQAQLTPEQRALAAPGAAPPGVAAPGLTLRPRGVVMTPELASSLTSLAREDPQAALRMLTQLDLQASQQRGTRTLTATEAQAYFAAIGSPQLYDPNKAYEVKAEGGLGVVPGTRESEEPTRQQRTAQENTLRSDFFERAPVKDYLALSSQVRVIRDAATREDPSRYNDINLVYAFAKMLDPNSVVRETEYGMVIEAGGIQQRIYRWGSVINGQSAFNDETRRQILREANGRYSSAREAYDVFADSYRDLARNAGVRPEMVVPPLPRFNVQEPAAGQQNQPRLAEDARQGAIDYLRSEIQSGRMNRQQAIQEARNAGIPNAERLFQ